MPLRTDIPVYRPDLYSASAIRDTYPHYAALRELGPVVWLSKHRVYALPRYAECRQVLLDDDTFASSEASASTPSPTVWARGPRCSATVRTTPAAAPSSRTASLPGRCAR